MIRETIIPESSRIHSAGYNPNTKVMELQFWNGYRDAKRPGPVYTYQNVSQEQWDAFMAAESKGTHFGQHFKGNPSHPYQKVEEEKKQ